MSSFVVANVLIDVEVLYFLYHRSPPLHRGMHTYAGGVAAGVVAAVAAYLAFTRIPGPWRYRGGRAMFLDSLVAGLTGGVSHVFLDSCMHHDMHPFWPLANGNELAGVLGVGALHAGLALIGLVGLVLWCLNSSFPQQPGGRHVAKEQAPEATSPEPGRHPPEGE